MASPWALTIVPGPEGLSLRLAGPERKVLLTPDAARQLAALLLVQAEHAEQSAAPADRCANGCEREAALSGYCEACIHAG